MPTTVAVPSVSNKVNFSATTRYSAQLRKNEVKLGLPKPQEGWGFDEFQDDGCVLSTGFGFTNARLPAAPLLDMANHQINPIVHVHQPIFLSQRLIFIIIRSKQPSEGSKSESARSCQKSHHLNSSSLLLTCSSRLRMQFG